MHDAVLTSHFHDLQVDKLGQFATEVTRVSQEVGTEGYVFFLVGAHSNSLCRLCRARYELRNLTNALHMHIVNSAGKRWCLTQTVHGASLLAIVNRLAANLTSQVRSIAKVTKAVALGDLSKQIEVDCSGEILDLKNTVNGMVIRLRALATEATRVTLEVRWSGCRSGC